MGRLQMNRGKKNVKLTLFHKPQLEKFEKANNFKKLIKLKFRTSNKQFEIDAIAQRGRKTSRNGNRYSNDRKSQTIT